MKQFKRFLWAASMLASPLILYICSYVCVVRQKPMWNMVVIVRAGQPPPPRPKGLPLAAYYRYGGRVAEIVYAPLAKIDQSLFPRRWLLTPQDLERIALEKRD